MQEGNTTAGETKRELIGPTEPPAPPVTKVNVVFMSEPPAEAVEETPAVDIKEAIADRIRTDCLERGILTSEDTLVGLAPGEQPHEAISAALAEMANDPEYVDIKAVTTASGLVFFYSERHMKVAEAAAKSLLEEVKFRIGERARADSKGEILTPVDALYEEIGWDRSAYSPDEIRKDPQYEDIKTVTAGTGDMFFYSNRHLSDYYALVLARLAAKDAGILIAETVRDESRRFPRPTCIMLFLERPFSVKEDELEAVVRNTLERPEFSDIKALIHPVTGAVYLFSNKYLDGERAFMKMDYEEVIRPANP